MTKEQLKPVAFIANFLFLTISGVTNFDGIFLIWGGDNLYLRYGVAVILAFGITALLFYISSLISDFSSEGKGARLIYGYIIISLFSVFFNFQSFYTRLTKSTILESSSKDYRDKLLKLKIEAQHEYLKYYNVKTLEAIVDSLKGERKAEKEHIQRPGEGTLFAGWNRQFQIDSNKFATANNQYLEKVNIISDKVENTVMQIDVAIKSEKQQDQLNAMDLGKQNFNSITNELKIINPNYKSALIGNNNETYDKPDRALKVLIDFLSGNSTLNSEQKSSVYLALFLSFFLDFPLFFTLIALNWKTKPTTNKLENNNSNIWQ